MSETSYNFNVTMTCSGCSGAIDRVLKKMDGLSGHDISLESQTVQVRSASGGPTYEQVLEKIKKTGKKVNSGEVVGQGPRDV